MTRQYHDNWLRIDFRCESDYDISFETRGVREGCYISIILKINPPNATHSPNAGLMLNYPIRCLPIISCNFSSPSRQYVVCAEVHAK